MEDLQCYVQGRNRCSLNDSTPHFRRSKAEPTSILCHRCAAPLRVADDDALRQAVHGTTWSLYGWKTFLCHECAGRAAVVSTHYTEGSYCLACYTTPSPPSNVMLSVPTKRGTTLTLCARCAKTDESQLVSIATRAQVRTAVVEAASLLSG